MTDCPFRLHHSVSGLAATDEKEYMMGMVKMMDINGSLTGKCLIAMPSLADSTFARSVIYICAHSPEGAMGLVVNRALDQLTFPDILDQMGIEQMADCESIRVHFGGPVESARGFVLHSADYALSSTLKVDGTAALTATTDVLRAIAEGAGPRRSLMALGYSGWGAGQLDSEIQENSWLTVDADEEILFSSRLESKWDLAVRRLGIDPTMLVSTAGHA
jgi:putative transcriptional regulator